MSKEKQNQEEPTIADPSFQDKDINLKALVISLAGTFLVVGFSFWAMKALYKAYEKGMYDKMETKAAVEVERQVKHIPKPLLQVDEPGDMVAFKAAEEKAVSSYGWIDKDTGKVQIPVDRAMKLLAEEKLPVRTDKIEEKPAEPKKEDAK